MAPWNEPLERILVLVFGGCKLTITFLKSPTFSKKLHLSFPLPRYFLRGIWAKWEAKLTPKAGWLFKLKNSGATVDGSEIRRSPVEVVGSLSYYLRRFFLHPNCGCLGFLNHPQYRKVWGLNRTQNFEFLESYKTAGRFSQQEKLLFWWIVANHKAIG